MENVKVCFLPCIPPMLPFPSNSLPLDICHIWESSERLTKDNGTEKLFTPMQNRY
jgi:hypothetical protein